MEERVVQVMFTVPRAKLRVVNADVLDAERDSWADEGAVGAVATVAGMSANANMGVGGASSSAVGGPSGAGEVSGGTGGSMKKDKGKGRGKLVERESEIFKRYDGSGWA